jgi:uncharacterized protein (DUF362 family)/NAD-dependent dihydropyrimidine dehydrogenase PreA subunit
MSAVSKAKVAIEKCGTYGPAAVGAAMDALLARLGGIEKFVKPGMRVFVKPNLLLAVAPNKACTTHPEILIAVIRRLQKAGAEVSFGDLPGGFHAGSTRNVHQVCEMSRVAEATGAELVTLEKHGFKLVNIPGAKKMKQIHAPRRLYQADAIINVCKLKTHMQAMMTCAVKNMFGMTTTQDRLIAHRFSSYRDFSEALVDIYSGLPKPALNIADAVIGMEGTGPTQGTPVKLGYLLGSADAVALDAVAAAAIGFQAHEIWTLEVARRRGIGTARLQDIEIVGERLEAVKKKVKRPSSAIFMLMPFVTNPFNELTKVRPYIIRADCEACKKCAEVCPGKAITFPDRAGVIDNNRCLLCFCCHEICPYGAVDIKRPFLVKIAERFQTR